MLGRPRLLLPQELWDRLDDTQQDAILAHELAHLKRRDHWVRRFETVVMGLYWWFPIAWWTRRQLTRAEEECCDAWVLWALPASASAYAEALLATASYLSGFPSRLPSGAMAVGHTISIKRRLNMIFDDSMRGPRIRKAPRTLLLIGTLSLPFLPAVTMGRAPVGGLQTAPASERSDTQNPPPGNEPAQKAVHLPIVEGSKHARFDEGKHTRKVRLCQAIAREVSDYEDYLGQIKAVQKVEIRARVSGYLLSATGRAGQMVERGAVLFQIDPRSYQAELDKATADVRGAEARRDVQARELTYARDLAARAAVSSKQVALNEGRAEEAEAGLASAKAVRDLAQLKLEYTRVRAPFAGQLGGPSLSPGEVVVADQTVLATLSTRDPMYVDFLVNQGTFLKLNLLKQQGKLKLGLEPELKLSAKLAGERDFRRPATLYSVDNEVNGMGQIRCNALVPNPDGLLLPGSGAIVRLARSEPHKAVLIPRSAVRVRPGNEGVVWVEVEPNVATFKVVMIGQSQSPDDSMVVRSGIQPGQWVVLDAPDGADATFHVVPERVPWPAPPENEKDR
jgi:multidrug efflux system membrane fusion protein